MESRRHVPEPEYWMRREVLPRRRREGDLDDKSSLDWRIWSLFSLLPFLVCLLSLLFFLAAAVVALLGEPSRDRPRSAAFFSVRPRLRKKRLVTVSMSFSTSVSWSDSESLVRLSMLALTLM